MTQKRLFSGLNCLPGQEDLFPTDGPAVRTVMHSLAFDMIHAARGWKPHYTVAIAGRRVCLIGPALATNTAAIERQWRTRLHDQACRLHDGARHDLLFRKNDSDGTGTDYYDCPATM